MMNSRIVDSKRVISLKTSAVQDECDANFDERETKRRKEDNEHLDDQILSKCKSCYSKLN